MSATIECFIRCAFCGIVVDRIDIEPGARWDHAEKWGYLAAKAHEPACPGRTAPLAEQVLQ